MPVMTSPSFGDQLRSWRRLRRWSQQSLADRAGLSSRHLSFLETGRSAPSREMVLRLADRLGVPLRERNPMLAAAGFAPPYRARPLDDPQMQAAGILLQGAEQELLEPPVNVVRLSLHPRGVAARIVNFRQWRNHILDRLRAQLESTGDAYLGSLIDEVCGYPQPPLEQHTELEHEQPGALLPLKLRSADGVLSFISTVTVFGTPHDITLQELAIETFFPADDFTAAQLAWLTR